VGATFRPKREAPADRSAADRLRHRQKIRSSIRENIADIIAEESIIGRDGDRVVKVPIRGVKEYRFIYGENRPGVGEGAGEETQRGDVVAKRSTRDGSGRPGEPGDEAGADYYETEVTLEELIDIMFEDLELPDLERKQLAAIESLRLTKRKGFRSVGLRVRLDRRRTIREKTRRIRARGRSTSTSSLVAPGGREPFHINDLRYRHRTLEIHKTSNAVVFCIMDTSGSMDTQKKYLARSFFFLLYQFVARRYESVEVVFIAHDVEAKEVNEDDFFHKGEAGGTFVSSGYRKALDVIADRYHPELWNIYAFHCSDGDNFGSDTPAAITAAKELCDVVNLFGYGEIKPRGAGYYGTSLLDTFKQIDTDNFQTVLIERKEDVWPSFRAFLGKDRAQA
jgi:sporulation protein YhbH